MSTKVMSLVFDVSEATGNDRLVLLAIADEADDDGTNAYPSINRLAAKVRVPKRTVMRCLQRLEDLGELAVERPETNGRGHFNRYRVLLGKGDTLTPEVDPDVQPDKGRGRARKGARSRTTRDRPIDPQTHDVDVVSDGPVSREEPSAAIVPITGTHDIDVMSPIDALCDQLASAIATQGGARPKITAVWRRDMRLLVERGPLDVEDAQPLPTDRVAKCIEFTFTHLAERQNGSGFCWADQIQSPGGLRKKWRRLLQAAVQLRDKQKGSAASTIDRVGDRLAAGESRLGLFPDRANQGG